MDLIEPAAAFTYLVRAIVYNNTDWAAVYHNLWKAQQCRGKISKVLMKTGATVRARGMLYKAVVHMVLLYRS